MCAPDKHIQSLNYIATHSISSPQFINNSKHASKPLIAIFLQPNGVGLIPILHGTFSPLDVGSKNPTRVLKNRHNPMNSKL